MLKNAGLLIGKAKGAAFAVRVTDLVDDSPAPAVATGPLLATREGMREEIAEFNRKLLNHNAEQGTAAAFS